MWVNLSSILRSIIGEFISYCNDAEYYGLLMKFILSSAIQSIISNFDSDNNKAELNSYHLENIENNLFV